MTVVADEHGPGGFSAWERLRGWLRNTGTSSPPRRRHLGLRLLVARPGAHRCAVPVQRVALRTVWQGFLDRWYWGDPSIRSGTTRRSGTRSSRA